MNMLRVTSIALIVLAAYAVSAQNCNLIVPVSSAAATSKVLSVQKTNSPLPTSCMTIFQLQDKTKRLAIKPVGLAATMNAHKAKLCKDGVAGIQFFDKDVKKADYCTGKCAAGTITNYADTEVILQKPVVRVYTNCPTDFKPTVSYRVVA